MYKAPDVLSQRTLSLNPIRHNRRKSKTGNSILVKLPIPQLQSASNSECAFDFLAMGGAESLCALIEN